MGKASLNKASISAVQSTAMPEAAPQVAEPVFSSGDLGQLQEILFGQQQRSTNEQISVLQKQFNEQLSSLGNVLNSRLNQLTETVDQYQINFDKRLSEIKTNTESAVENISQTIGSSKTELLTNINALSKSTLENTERIDADLANYKSKLLKEINNTKQDLKSDLSHSIDALDRAKLDKQELVQLLSGVSEKLTDSATLSNK